jgi:predicted Fe-Mo cluster-binding NifX family protein
MKIAITVWGNRISPVFDCAKTLMIAQVEDCKIVKRVFEKFNPLITTPIALVLKNNQIDVLICGALTERQSEIIKQEGIKLISFVSGNAENVLLSYIKEPLLIVDFLMPGTITEATLSKNVFNF